MLCIEIWGNAVAPLATIRKDAGSISVVVIGTFHRCNPSGCTMTLGTTQLLTEMSTRDISWGVKAAVA